MSRALAVAMLAACSTPPASVEVASATPPYAPLGGGTTTRLTGSGFLENSAGANRVLVASREVPLARVIDDATLEIVVPPGERPGDAEVVVLNDNGNARATGVLRYSEPPTIASVAPVDVVFTSTDTVVTVTGTGFLDEGAGLPTVVVDGRLADYVSVTSDTTLTFVAPEGLALVRPDIELGNERGVAMRPRAFRYTPSTREGLLLFSTFGPAFAVFYDPSDNSTVTLPRAAAPGRFTAIVRDDLGDYWGVDRSRRFGPIDMRTQRLATPSALQAWLPALTRVDSRYLGISRNHLRLGELDPVSGGVTPIGPQLPCCGSYGIAFTAKTLYVTSRSATGVEVASIDPVTGIRGTPVPITGLGTFHIEDMRAFKGGLYVTATDGFQSGLFTLDPATGVATAIPLVLGTDRFAAIEVFEP